MTKRTHATVVLLVTSLLALPAPLALAEERHEPRREEHFDFRGRDFHHFSPHERDIWRGGRWHHDWHDGRFGWWWEVAGIWYFYDAPVYPYPTSVPAVVVRPAPAPVAPQVQREVVYPHGKYVLYGDGVTQPWQWVWVPAAPVPSPPPPPPPPAGAPPPPAPPPPAPPPR